MARKASGTEQLEVAMERLEKAKTAAELRAAQAIVLPLALGLSLEQNAHPVWSSDGRRKESHTQQMCLCNRAKTSLVQEATIDMLAYAPDWWLQQYRAI